MIALWLIVVCALLSQSAASSRGKAADKRAVELGAVRLRFDNVQSRRRENIALVLEVMSAAAAYAAADRSATLLRMFCEISSEAQVNPLLADFAKTLYRDVDAVVAAALSLIKKMKADPAAGGDLSAAKVHEMLLAEVAKIDAAADQDVARLAAEEALRLTAAEAVRQDADDAPPKKGCLSCLPCFPSAAATKK